MLPTKLVIENLYRFYFYTTNFVSSTHTHTLTDNHIILNLIIYLLIMEYWLVCFACIQMCNWPLQYKFRLFDFARHTFCIAIFMKLPKLGMVLIHFAEIFLAVASLAEIYEN